MLAAVQIARSKLMSNDDWIQWAEKNLDLTQVMKNSDDRCFKLELSFGAAFINMAENSENQRLDEIHTDEWPLIWDHMHIMFNFTP